MNLERRIVCAANKHGYVVIPSARHWDTNMHNLARRIDPDYKDYEWEQGFINTWGEFLTRQEAWKVAEYNNQIVHRVGSDRADGGTLYSENLY